MKPLVLILLELMMVMNEYRIIFWQYRIKLKTMGNSNHLHGQETARAEVKLLLEYYRKQQSSGMEDPLGVQNF